MFDGHSLEAVGALGGKGCLPFSGGLLHVRAALRRRSVCRRQVYAG